MKARCLRFLRITYQRGGNDSANLLHYLDQMPIGKVHVTGSDANQGQILAEHDAWPTARGLNRTG